MEIQYIDITTYRGISSNAEHFYATIGTPNMKQEMLLTNPACNPVNGVLFVNQEQMRYKPTKEEAEAIWEKDNKYNIDPSVRQNRENAIFDLMDDGTIRFPSIVSIVRTARKAFPKAVLCFSFCGSQKEFVKRFVLPLASGNNQNELIQELESLITEKEKQLKQ